MGGSWQTPEQKAFIEENTPSFTQHSTDGTKKEFWLNFLAKWFKAWPLPEPSPELVAKEGMDRAMKLERSKKIGVSTVYPLMNLPELTIRTATQTCLRGDFRRHYGRRSTKP